MSETISVLLGTRTFPHDMGLRCSCGKQLTSGRVCVTVQFAECLYFLGTESGAIKRCCGIEHSYMAVFESEDEATATAQRYVDFARKSNILGERLAEIIPLVSILDGLHPTSLVQ